jgi:cyanate permease
MWSGRIPMIPHYILFWILLFSIFGFAWWRGGTEEKIAASICVLATIVTHFVASPLAQRYSNVETGLLAIDLVVLLCFVGIALYSTRFWPLWAAGFQLTVTMSHLLKGVQLDLLPRAYAAAAVFWSYPILFVIVVGTWRARKVRFLRYPSG